MLNTIRVGVSGVLIRGDAILLVEFDDPDASERWHFNLPGGGVEPGETLHEAMRREFLEETTAEVEVGRLLLIWEYVPTKQNYKYGDQQVLRLVFECHLREGSEPRLPETPDTFQIGLRWTPLAELPNVPLLPRIADRLLVALNTSPAQNDYVLSIV